MTNEMPMNLAEHLHGDLNLIGVEMSEVCESDATAEQKDAKLRKLTRKLFPKLRQTALAERA